ncbi:MAG TPA: HAMP domain-containing sensor histidine kinase [Candidatus Krumholzibacteria bacterium]|nr:HAMP domain-containing sensor histidine kinase [Candidatus Krumholzibacteria bacterium]
MFRFGNLRTRIIALTTVPLIAILVTILFSAIHAANHAVRERVQQSLAESGSVFVQMLTSRRNELVSMAQVTVRDPRFFAPFSIPREERGAEFIPTVGGVASDFLRITDADFIEIFDANGRLITCVTRSADDGWMNAPARTNAQEKNGHAGIEMAMKGSAVADFYQMDNQLVAAAVAPVYVLHNLEAIVRIGSFLDDEFVSEVKRLTGADVCLARAGIPLATTYPSTTGEMEAWRPTARVASSIAKGSVTLSEAFSREHENREYLTIHVGVGGVAPDDGFDAFVGRELMTEMTPILVLEKRLVAGGVAAVIVTLLVGWFAASSISRPLSRIVQASVALTRGQYDFPIDQRGNDEVALLGRNFAHMRESLATYVQHLKNLDQAKSNFIALAGHELRTPLTIISGFNEMIASGALGTVPANMRETTNLITEQLTGLNRLVQSMLDLTYYEQGLQTLELARRDVRDLVRDAALGRKEVAEKRHLRMTVDLGPETLPVMVDAIRFNDAVLALIDNAIRFTADGGLVRVRTMVVGMEVHVSVEDTGIGIPHNELKWIFEKIYEVGDVMHHTSGTHKYGSKGFGMGLALCKVIIEKHGGKVLVTSALGRGSTFTLVLPRAATGAIAPAPAPEKQGALV